MFEMLKISVTMTWSYSTPHHQLSCPRRQQEDNIESRSLPYLHGHGSPENFTVAGLS